MRQFPTEIEADIAHRYPGRSVLEWWRGEMSSRELWVFISKLPDRSETKKAMRDGDWSEEQYFLAHIINSLDYFRADHAAIHAGEKMRVDPLESPRQRAERAEQDEARKQVGNMLRAQLRGEYTPPPRDVTFEIVDTPTVKGGAHG